MTRRDRTLYPERNYMVKGWWKLAAAARYLQTVEEATAHAIIEHARSKSGTHIDLNPRELSVRLARHLSFKSRKDGKNKSNPVLWRIINDNIFKENPNKRGKRV
jgi:hypothetical protein